MPKTSQKPFYFKKQDSLGANDAEDDKKYLHTCFVDTGDYDLVKDMSDARCLVLGRTGVGKTALIAKLDEDKAGRVIHINPESLAMQHISNSTIIQYLDELDIDLNTFFKLLWRHALCVEIFTHHFKVSDEYDFEKLLEDIRYRLKNSNPRHLRALDYLYNWRSTFWKENESHVTEMISKTESKVRGEFGGSPSAVSAKLSKIKNASEEEKILFKSRAQTIVDETQMKEVSDLIGMLNEVVEFQQKQYYLIIDKLDEGWVENKLRYRLIKALIETVRDLNRHTNIKPIVVLRADLLGHVFELTKDVGFQEEKYQSLYLNVRWTKTQLTELIDLRINELLRSRYSKRTKITHKEILPPKVNDIESIEFILSRTLMRPRDVIEFFNACIMEATDSTHISEQMILDAEHLYSRARLESLYYEWTADYPRLKEWVAVLRRRSTSFLVSDLSLDDVKERCMYYVLENPLQVEGLIQDRLYTLAEKLNAGHISAQDFRRHLVFALYTTGLIGIKLEGLRDTVWSYESSRKISVEDIEDSTNITVHPCFASALNSIPIDSSA